LWHENAKEIVKQKSRKKIATQRKKCQNIVRGRGRLSYLVAKMSSGRHILAGKKRYHSDYSGMTVK